MARNLQSRDRWAIFAAVILGPTAAMWLVSPLFSTGDESGEGVFEAVLMAYSIALIALGAFAVATYLAFEQRRRGPR